MTDTISYLGNMSTIGGVTLVPIQNVDDLKDLTTQLGITEEYIQQEGFPIILFAIPPPEEIPVEQRKHWYSIPRRYLIAYLILGGFCCSYIMRVNLSVAIVDMTGVTKVLKNGTEHDVREFDWDSEQQALALSAFYYGYLLTCIPGGWIASRLGGNYVFGIAVGANALLSLILPVVVDANFYGLVALKVIDGMFQGCTQPAHYTIWSRWSPPLERSTLVNISASGIHVGSVIGFYISGVITSTIGWQFAFYIPGIISLIWTAIWLWIVKASPEKDKHVSSSERKYIQYYLRKEKEGYVNEGTKSEKEPWGKFMTSLPVWAIIVATFCDNWGLFFLLSYLPQYMTAVLEISLKDSSRASALPYLVMAIILQFTGVLADRLIQHKIFSVVVVRKMFTCGAFTAQAIFLILAVYVNNAIGFICCVTAATGIGAFSWAGYSVNLLDIAPQFAGCLMGISNGLGVLPGFLAPTAAGLIVQDNTITEWRILFCLTGGVYAFGCLFYGLFASSTLQDWALPTELRIERLAARRRESQIKKEKVLIRCFKKLCRRVKKEKRESQMTELGDTSDIIEEERQYTRMRKKL